VLTGAGISAESGIKTFRDTGGLWENARIEDVATPEAFARDPQLVYEFYNARRKQLKPNAAHFALAELANTNLINLTLITQNVDNLHERAGSQDVIHMHGELLSACCTYTQQAVAWQGELDATHQCSCCKPANKLRPNIVWFGEIPMHMERIYRAISSADVFAAIGTSGSVYPAAGFVDIAFQAGVSTALINAEDTRSGMFEKLYLGKASDCVPNWIKDLKESYGLE
jgi:NAD-dependent deacetylase